MSARVDALAAGYRREVLHRWLLTWAGRLVSLYLAFLYVYLLMFLGRDDPFYISLNLVAFVVGMSGFVTAFYYEVPGIVRALHSPDPALADDAWAAIERLRGELLPRLLVDLNVPADERPELARTLDRAGVVRLTEARARDRWRTIGPLYLAGFTVALAAYFWLLYTWVPATIR
ncbi:hypothetical protein [Nannocystis punicea]|uniref:DUF4175 domain-containing protein n=1 Tax=Nannocystis punicea TaxID=2995304 RepID=A0ABY7HI14_9BACT|nr:hypothetical protein [Nannocystis poenicansa]WAS98981.1 hypothetical protein O0S08_22860 [Nannocystis poenicansa]